MKALAIVSLLLSVSALAAVMAMESGIGEMIGVSSPSPNASNTQELESLRQELSDLKAKVADLEAQGNIGDAQVARLTEQAPREAVQVDGIVT